MLAETAGAMPVQRVVQRLRRPDPHSYVGKGKLAEIVELVGREGASVVIFDDELTPAQQRALESALAVKVIDRTALILDIFAQRARTNEGGLQVALAQHEYLLPRLAGQWSHLERMEGAIGLRGPGETQLETDRRLVRIQIKTLKRRIEQVRRHRREQRRRRAGMPVVALVGYTNAGKSTLLNGLTHAGVRVHNRLFETLDPTTRRWVIDIGAAGRPGARGADGARRRTDTVLLTDTVGFIQKLPTQLIAAFRATLEELQEADILLHVIDITHADAADQAQAVEETLAELGLLTGDDAPVTHHGAQQDRSAAARDRLRRRSPRPMPWPASSRNCGARWTPTARRRSCWCRRRSDGGSGRCARPSARGWARAWSWRGMRPRLSLARLSLARQAHRRGG